MEYLRTFLAELDKATSTVVSKQTDKVTMQSIGDTLLDAVKANENILLDVMHERGGAVSEDSCVRAAQKKINISMPYDKPLACRS